MPPVWRTGRSGGGAVWIEPGTGGASFVVPGSVRDPVREKQLQRFPSGGREAAAAYVAGTRQLHGRRWRTDRRHDLGG
ncbi:hypothetical protein NDU88_001179 [Pleurodeles waltl]|uniref:Uncharacterized protein n=1 Tax=Pleurodeles waltl TaxID=8319 RepID=A0AAV7L8Y7_PLEWA|nr:hypothetical protein NDU88_001179 [Pleurodeles waltl]